MIKTFNQNAASHSRENVSKILLFFDVERFIIGDSCDRLAKVKICHEVFPGSEIDLCCNHSGFSHLVKNNPYLNKFWITENWDDIEFLDYDLMICVSYRETQLFDHLVIRYNREMMENKFSLTVLAARNLYDNANGITFVFPSFHDYYKTDFISKESLRNEIFVSEDERDWGKQWLIDRGVKDHEKLIIVIDNSNSRAKLLSLNVHFSILRFFLQIPDSKILVFDENGLGKKKFYTAWLGYENIEKRFVFAERTSLRASLCLISAQFVSFIFGPCTGILHCASGVYNVLRKRKGKDFVTPPMLVYRGNQGDDNPFRWWGNSLASCVLIKRNGDGRPYAKCLGEEDRDDNVALKDLVAVSEFTSDILVNFMIGAYGETIGRRATVK